MNSTSDTLIGAKAPLHGLRPHGAVGAGIRKVESGLKIKKLSDRIKEEKEMKVNNKDEEYELKSRDPSDVPKAGCALFDDL